MMVLTRLKIKAILIKKQTCEGGVKPLAHLKRVGDGGSLIKSGLVNGHPRV